MISKLLKVSPGILLALVIAILAWYLGKILPIVGGPIFGILLGILLAFWQRPSVFEAGIGFTGKKLLQAAIILLGFEMNLYNVFKVGGQSFFVMLFTLSAAFVTAWLVGYRMKLPGNTATLIGVGTAVCGGSAIAAIAPVINADDKEVTYAISTIFLFNLLAVFIFPLIGHGMNMSDTGFGMWAGTAINDTSSVVAAGYTYSDIAGDFSAIVKLTRTLMIVPIALVLAVYTAKRSAGKQSVNIKKVFPWFVLGFIIASLINTLGIISPELCKLLMQSGKFLIVMAMSAIGLNTNLKQLIGNGIKPIMLGLSCSLAVALTSIIAQYMLKMW